MHISRTNGSSAMVDRYHSLAAMAVTLPKFGPSLR